MPTSSTQLECVLKPLWHRFSTGGISGFQDALLLHRTLQIAFALSILVPASTVRAVDDAAVNAAIKEGVAALLNHLRDDDEITYQRGPNTVTVRGRVTKSNRDSVQITTTDRKTLSITRSTITTWKQAGLVRDEMGTPCEQGRSTLAALALAAAGVETTHPKMEQLLAILEDGPGNSGGTYVHGLRASLWSTLLDRPLAQTQRNRFRKLLKQDVDWLQRAGQQSGWYSYTHAGGGGDHSNTQFANLGLWSGSISAAEVGTGHWQRMGRHWLETQNPDGGWAYQNGMGHSTPSMTVAGCNSLYIALDRYYTRPEQSYKVFEGIAIDRASRERIKTIHAAISRGDKYLEAHPPDAAINNGYELFGLERLGLASGRAYLGGQDWFRIHAPGVCRRDWGEDVVGDAFGVIFLVHGQAPILIQKLEHGDTFDDWNFYQRDLGNLTRFFNRTFERLHRWQRIPVNATLRDMQDAPMLYIASSGALELPNETLQRIREYVNEGGTVLLHADRANRKFRDAAEPLFENVFKEYDWRFTDVPTDHAIYRCQFGGVTTPWKRTAPLRAIQDGARLPIILFPVDIAGAWQQDRGPFEDMFRIMANLRVYCAPAYYELPRRLRSAPVNTMNRPSRGMIRIARLDMPGTSRAHPAAWGRFAAAFRQHAGIELRFVNTLEWKQADVVHLAVAAGEEIDDTLYAHLRDYVRTGGMLLLDAIDGQPAAIEGVRIAADNLAIGDAALLPSNHSIISGTMPVDRALDSLETTEAGVGLRQAGTTPPILIQTTLGSGCVLQCPFDLTAGMDGCYIWKRIGYRTDSTRRLVENILLWRMNELTRRGRK